MNQREFSSDQKIEFCQNQNQTHQSRKTTGHKSKFLFLLLSAVYCWTRHIIFKSWKVQDSRFYHLLFLNHKSGFSNNLNLFNTSWKMKSFIRRSGHMSHWCSINKGFPHVVNIFGCGSSSRCHNLCLPISVTKCSFFIFMAQIFKRTSSRLWANFKQSSGGLQMQALFKSSALKDKEH